MASLNKYLYQRNRLLPNYVAAYLVSQAAQGLEHLHQMRDRQNNAVQILHTDLGPHNLLVGKNGAIKLIDFSFALSAHNLKMTGSEESWVPLTAISPERAKGEPFGASSDIFELGLVFYELLTGCTPFGDKKERALYEAIKNYHIKELLLPDSMEPFLKKIFKKCLFHLQEERYASALNFERDLTKYMDIFHSEHSRLDIENYLSKVLNPNLPTLIPTSKSASNR
jgi:serine/threonine protein kinase